MIVSILVIIKKLVTQFNPPASPGISTVRHFQWDIKFYTQIKRRKSVIDNKKMASKTIHGLLKEIPIIDEYESTRL